MTEPDHHFSDDVLRGYAVGAASEGAELAVACHLAFCGACRAGAAAHESVLDLLLADAAAADADAAGRVRDPAFRDALLAGLPAAPAPAGARRRQRPGAAELPAGMPELPGALLDQLGTLPHPGKKLAWKLLIPGIRAIDLGITSAWRARLVRFRPGVPIPIHDHGGPEHTVVFSGGLDDHHGHLGRGDATTMLPGDAHRQRSSPGEPCVALIINEAPPRPLTFTGRILKRLTRS